MSLSMYLFVVFDIYIISEAANMFLLKHMQKLHFGSFMEMGKCSCGCWGEWGVYRKCNKRLRAIFYLFICTEGGLSEKKVSIIYIGGTSILKFSIFLLEAITRICLCSSSLTDNLTLGRLYQYLGWCICNLVFVGRRKIIWHLAWV